MASDDADDENEEEHAHSPNPTPLDAHDGGGGNDADDENEDEHAHSPTPSYTQALVADPTQTINQPPANNTNNAQDILATEAVRQANESRLAGQGRPSATTAQSSTNHRVRKRRKRHEPEEDHSARARERASNSSRTGQACDRCKVRA